MKLALNMKVSTMEIRVLVSRLAIPPKRRKAKNSQVFPFCFVKTVFHPSLRSDSTVQESHGHFDVYPGNDCFDVVCGIRFPCTAVSLAVHCVKSGT